VHREANRLSGEATLAHHYGMPNVARRLLEAFLAFRLPAINGDLSKRLDQLPFDAAKRLRILRFVHRYSHGDAIAGLDEDPSGLAETQPVLRDLLELMKATDPSHYEGLEQLMRPRAED
jgi:wobble nucleotide-excising tRNase